MVRAQRGDGAAFEELAKGSVDRLHDVAHNILSDARLAEDATQQALLDIWQDLPRLREPTRFEAWSYRICVRACYDEARRERRWMPSLPSFGVVEAITADEMAAVVDREQLERGFRCRLSDPLLCHPPRGCSGHRVPLPPLPRPIGWSGHAASEGPMRPTCVPPSRTSMTRLPAGRGRHRCYGGHRCPVR